MPYQIDPGTSLDGELVEDYCERRWGGSGWTSHLIAEGRKDGARFKNWKWWPNTLKAHQLVQYAQDNSNEDAAVMSSKANDAIFHALYEEGENISLVDVLVKIGQQLGLEKAPLQEYLENDAGASRVQKEIELGRRRYRIKGVPFFVIGGEGSDARPYGISGAHDPKTFLELFEELGEANL